VIETIQMDSPNILGFKLSGKLHDEDYKTFVPTVEAAVTAEGKVRLFAQLEDFHGWDMRASWDDFKFGLKHNRDIERVAMVGDHKWERWMSVLCRPFTSAKVRYFDVSEIDAARNWVAEN
jgi:hypothetical protein